MSIEKKVRRLKAKLAHYKRMCEIHEDARRTLEKEARGYRDTIEQLRRGNMIAPTVSEVREEALDKLAEVLDVPRHLLGADEPGWYRAPYDASEYLREQTKRAAEVARAKGSVPRTRVVGHIEDEFDTIGGRVSPGFRTDLKPVETES